MAYTTQQSVLMAAGKWARLTDQVPAGSANGSNRVFTVDHRPLADNDDNDTIDASDVTAYVNGTAVTVSSVVAATGAITLAAAPASNATVTIDYSYSAVPATSVAKAIEEAQAWIDDELASVIKTPLATVSATVRKITKWYAAGLLLGDESGISSSSEQPVSEGKAKIEQAEKWLAAHRARLAENGNDAGTTALPTARPQERLFDRYSASEGVWRPADEQFNANREY